MPRTILIIDEEKAQIADLLERLDAIGFHVYQQDIEPRILVPALPCDKSLSISHVLFTPARYDTGNPGLRSNNQQVADQLYMIRGSNADRLSQLPREQFAQLNQSKEHHHRLVAEDLEIDLDRYEVTVHGHVITLSKRLFDLLVYFVQNRGIALSRSHIFERVWGYTFEGDSRTIDVHVRWLRERIEHDPSHPQLLITVRGVGYRFL